MYIRLEVRRRCDCNHIVFFKATDRLIAVFNEDGSTHRHLVDDGHVIGALVAKRKLVPVTKRG